jgi:hypothetical protein
MKDADALVRETRKRLAGLARPASDHPASGGYGSRLRRLGLRALEIRAAARGLARECRDLPPREVVRVAQALVDGATLDGGQVGYLLLERHRGALAARVVREVTHKLVTGRKRPRGGRRAAIAQRRARPGPARRKAAR